MARITWGLLLLCFLVTSALITIPTGAAAPQPSQPPKKMGPAPSSPPPPKGAVDCSTVIFDMMDCLDYVCSGSNTSKPEESCCEGIKAVVQLSPSCICEALQEAANMKIDINMTRAMALPTACNIIAAPSIDSCRIATPPAGAPAPSKSNVPSPSLPPSLLVPVPSSTPAVPSSPAQPPTTTPHPSAAAPLPSGSSSSLLYFSLVVLVMCLAAPALLYF